MFQGIAQSAIEATKASVKAVVLSQVASWLAWDPSRATHTEATDL